MTEYYFYLSDKVSPASLGDTVGFRRCVQDLRILLLQAERRLESPCRVSGAKGAGGEAGSAGGPLCDGVVRLKARKWQWRAMRVFGLPRIPLFSQKKGAIDPREILRFIWLTPSLRCPNHHLTRLIVPLMSRWMSCPRP